MGDLMGYSRNNPRVITPPLENHPIQYPESTAPWVGYQAPAGSTPWQQGLFREIGTPVDGGYNKTQYFYEKDGKKYYSQLDNNLKIDITFPKLADQWRYGSNYRDFTRANTRLFWSNPQRVARVKEMVDNMPEGEQIPDWLDVDKLTTLYNYLAFKNPNKPYDQWAPLTEDDPAYSMLYQIPNPPQDIVSPYERDPVYVANKFLEDYKKNYDPNYLNTMVKNIMESRGITFEEAQNQVNEELKADYTKLEPYQQFLLAIQSMTPQDSNAPGWMKEVSALSGTAKTGVAAASMSAAIVGGINFIGTSAAIGGGLPGGLIAAGTAIPLMIATYAAIKRGDEVTANKLMALWNKPAEWAEQLIGSLETGSQLRQLGINPNRFSPGEIWDASKAYYESELYGIGNFEANAVSAIAHTLNKDWSSGMQAGAGQVWQFQKGLVEPQAIREGYLVGMPLAEATIRLANGENDEAVYWDIVDRFGYSGTRADFHAQNWIDPLQYVPFLTSIFGEKIAGKLNNPKLAHYFAKARGNIFLDALPGSIQMPLGIIFGVRNRFGASRGWKPWHLNTSKGIFDVFNEYGVSVRNETVVEGLPMTAYGVENLSTMGKILAGIDPKTNMPRRGVVESQAPSWKLASGWARAAAGTPQGTIMRNLEYADSALTYIRALTNDPLEFDMQLTRLLEGADYVKNNKNDPYAYAYDSPTARAIRSGLAETIQGDAYKTLTTLWKETDFVRTQIAAISQATGITPAKLIEMMKADEFTGIVSKINKDTAPTKFLKALTAEGLKKLTKTMLTNDIPFFPEMMTAKLADTVVGSLGDIYTKAYGVDITKQTKIAKWLGLNKSAMSLVLLNTPFFTAKNLLNNFVTMGYDGVGSLFTVRYSDAISKKYDIPIPKNMTEGFGARGLMPGPVTDAKSLADYLQKGANEIQKAALFSWLAGKIEGSAKQAAFTNGLDKHYPEAYQASRPPMPDDLRADLANAGINPSVVESIIGSATKASDFENILNHSIDPATATKTINELNARVDIDGAVTDAITKLGIDDVIARDLVTKLAIADNAIRYMKENDISLDLALSRVYDEYKAKALDNWSKDIVDTYNAKRQEISTSGWGAIAMVLDETGATFPMEMLESAVRLHDITNEARDIRKRNPGKRGKQLANALYNAMYDQEVRYITTKYGELAENILAIVHRLDPANAVEARLSDLLIRRTNLIEESMHFVADENSKYFGLEEDIKYEDVETKVRQGQENYAKQIESLNIEIDNAMLEIFNLDAITKKRAETWIANNRAMRNKLSELNKKTLRKMSSLDEAGKRVAWQKALDERRKIIAEHTARGIEYAEKVNQSRRQKKNAPPEPTPPGANEPDTEVQPKPDNNIPEPPDMGPFNPDDLIDPQPDTRSAYMPKSQTPTAEELYNATLSGDSANKFRDEQKQTYRLDQLNAYNTDLLSRYHDPDNTRALFELSALHNKRIANWEWENADELKTMRIEMQRKFNLSNEQSKMTFAFMTKRASNFAFRIGSTDPMEYMRRYVFESTTQAALNAQAKLSGWSEKVGPASINWDIERSKWVLKAAETAGPRELLHELIHSWIFELDRSDMVALNEIFGYANIETLYNNHRGWLTGRYADGTKFDPTAYNDYLKRSERVVKIAEEYFYQRGGIKISADVTKAGGIPLLIQKFRNFAVDILGSYRKAWTEEEKGNHNIWLANNPINENIEIAFTNLYEGYRLDQVWDPSKPYLQRTPSMASKQQLADVFGFDGDGQYTMYRINGAEADDYIDALNNRAGFYRKKSATLSGENAVAPDTGERIELLLPDNLETEMPVFYADKADTWGHPGKEADSLSLLEQKHKIDLFESDLFEPWAENTSAINKVTVKFTPEEASALIIRDTDGEAFRLLTETGLQSITSILHMDPKSKAHRWYISSDIAPLFRQKQYEQIWNNVYNVLPELMPKNVIDDYAKRIVYWASYRDSGLYGWTDADFDGLRERWITKNNTVTDPELIRQAEARFNYLVDLSKLITKSADLYDKMLKWDLPPLLKPEEMDYSIDQPIRYTINTGQYEAAATLKAALTAHHDKIKVQGHGVWPGWKLPSWMEDALNPTAVKPTGEPTPATNTTKVESSTHSRKLGQFPTTRQARKDDYFKRPMSSWPAEDADAVKQTIYGWLVDNEKPLDEITSEDILTFNPPFAGRKAIDGYSKTVKDNALKAILLGDYDQRKSVHSTILAGVLDHLGSKPGNIVYDRLGPGGEWTAKINTYYTQRVDPLVKASTVGYDERFAEVYGYYGRKAMDFEEIKATEIAMAKDLKDLLKAIEEKKLSPELGNQIIRKFMEMRNAYKSAMKDYLIVAMSQTKLKASLSSEFQPLIVDESIPFTANMKATDADYKKIRSANATRLVFDDSNLTPSEIRSGKHGPVIDIKKADDWKKRRSELAYERKVIKEQPEFSGEPSLTLDMNTREIIPASGFSESSESYSALRNQDENDIMTDLDARQQLSPTTLESKYGLGPAINDIRGEARPLGEQNYVPNQLLEGYNRAVADKDWELADAYKEQLLDEMTFADPNLNDNPRYMSPSQAEFIETRMGLEIDPSEKPIETPMRKPTLWEANIQKVKERAHQFIAMSNDTTVEDTLILSKDMSEAEIIKASEELEARLNSTEEEIETTRQTREKAERATRIANYEQQQQDMLDHLRKAKAEDNWLGYKPTPANEADAIAYDTEKVFIDGATMHFDGVKRHKTNVTAEDYWNAQVRINARIAQAYEQWEIMHPGFLNGKTNKGVNWEDNKDFLVYMQRHVFPTLANKNRSDNVYAHTVNLRMDMLLNTSYDNARGFVESVLGGKTKFTETTTATELADMFEAAITNPEDLMITREGADDVRVSDNTWTLREYMAWKMETSAKFRNLLSTPSKPKLSQSSILSSFYSNLAKLGFSYDDIRAGTNLPPNLRLILDLLAKKNLPPELLTRLTPEKIVDNIENFITRDEYTKFQNAARIEAEAPQRWWEDPESNRSWGTHIYPVKSKNGKIKWVTEIIPTPKYMDVHAGVKEVNMDFDYQSAEMMRRGETSYTAPKNIKFEEEFWKAYENQDAIELTTIARIGVDRITKLISEEVMHSPIENLSPLASSMGPGGRLITAADALLELFPHWGKKAMGDDQKQLIFNYVNAVFKEASDQFESYSKPTKYTDPVSGQEYSYDHRSYLPQEAMDAEAEGITYREEIINPQTRPDKYPAPEAVTPEAVTPEAVDYLNNPPTSPTPAKPRKKRTKKVATPTEPNTVQNTQVHEPVGPDNSLGTVPPPLAPGKAMMEELSAVKNIIDEMRANARNYDSTNLGASMNTLAPEVRTKLYDYIDNSKKASASAKQYAYDMSILGTKNALLDYNDRTGMDTWMDAVFPYQFWFTRSMVNWAKRAMNRPGILSQYANRLVHMQRLGAYRERVPLRLQGKMQIPWPFAEEWMGDSIYINPFMDTMPVNQLLSPIEYMARQNTIDPTQELKRMLNEKDITREEYNYAIENQEGEHWNAAYITTAEEVKQTTRPIDLASMMMSPNWLLTEIPAMINKDTQRNWPGTNVGITLESHGNRIKDSGYQMVGDALIAAGKVMEAPEKFVRGDRFVYYGEYGPYIINRELASMAAEGKNTQDCIKAMVEKKGDLWDEANRRVMDQVSLKTPGSLLFQAIEEGDYNSIPLGLLITMFPGGIFPEGELKQRGLSESFNQMWTKAGEGDTTWMAKWFDDNPEYLVRSAINDSPRLMMKKFLVNQIMDYYTSQDTKNKVLFKEHLGKDFIDKILKGDSVDYNALDLEELSRWARMARGEVPNTADTAGMQGTLPDKDMPVMYDEQQLLQLNVYFDERNRLYPNQSWQNKAYHNLTTKREKSIYLAKYPELKQYWEWNNAYQTQAPVVKEFLNRNVTETGETIDPYYGVSKELVDGYRAEKARLFPNSQWLNAEYFAIPSDNYQERRAFISKYPELEQYWNWKNEIEAQSPQLKYYNAQMDAQFMEENAFPVAPADMAPNKIAEALDAMGLNQYVSQDLLDYYVRGKPIPFGSLSYMKDLWEKAGKPDTLMEWIDNLF